MAAMRQLLAGIAAANACSRHCSRSPPPSRLSTEPILAASRCFSGPWCADNRLSGPLSRECERAARASRSGTADFGVHARSEPRGSDWVRTHDARRTTAVAITRRGLVFPALASAPRDSARPAVRAGRFIARPVPHHPLARFCVCGDGDGLADTRASLASPATRARPGPG